MCPPYPPPKSMFEILFETVEKLARDNPEMWTLPDIDTLDYVGVP